jgi:predicted membrane protein
LNFYKGVAFVKNNESFKVIFSPTLSKITLRVLGIFPDCKNKKL